jgi:flagellar basal-body rod protein FlgC
MMDAISSAVSGLIAAGRRLSGSASNLANSGDTARLTPAPGDAPAFQPVVTVESAVAGGGTVATYQPVSPASHPAYQPDSPFADAEGLVAAPNVDATRETVAMITARQAYEANLKTVATAQRMQDSLLKVLA